LQNYKKIKQN